MAKRVTWLFSGLLLILTGVILRIGYLSEGSGFFATAQEQASTTVTVATQRGTIYDRNRKPLVNAQADYHVCVAPYAAELSDVMEVLSAEQRKTLTARLQTGRPVVQTVPGLLPSAEGVLQFVARSRYGSRVLAPHIIGYLDGDGLSGVSGIEAAFNERLSAAAGAITVTYTVDGTGIPLKGVAPEIANTLAASGAGVVLTLDSTLQRVAENVTENSLARGAVVIMEPATGRILASVSRPDFQPSTVGQLLEDETAPLLNRALSNYNCGSVFKIVTAAAALENGILPGRAFTCTGSVTVGDTAFYCHNKLGHGRLDMKEAFAQSCNSYFIQLAQETGPVALRRMAVTLGFDQALFLAGDLKTARASLPTAAELAGPAELANLSFGQGALLASPVHIARMLTAVIGDGVLQKATLLQGYAEADGSYTEEAAAPPQTAFSAATAALLRDFMQHTVEAGSGTAAKPAVGGAGGKTGTAETGWTQNGSDIVQSWFAGYYPAEAPRYIIVVLAEDKNNTGVVAAPVFKKLCDALEAVSQ